MTFGRLLQTLRQERELTQEQLAASAGVALATVRHYEHKLRLPSLANATALARALGVSVDVLTACDEMAPPPAANDGKKGAR